MRDNITAIDHVLARMNALRDLPTIMRSVQNWQDIIFFRFGLKREIIVRMKSGRTMSIRNNDEYFRFVHGTKEWVVELGRQLEGIISIKRGRILVSFLGYNVPFAYDSADSLGSTLDLAIEQFIKKQYSWLRVRDKTVVDIGASIGDTPIYFAMMGANHVYAIEPFPRTYETAKKNIRLNGLGKRITLINKGVGKEKRFVKMSRSMPIQTGSFLREGFTKNGKRVEVLTLADIVKRYGIRDGVLKMDCEGCEHDSILNTSREVLKLFDQIEIEYHYGYLDLEKKLREAGFEVRHTIPKYSGYGNVRDPSMYIGLILAEKI